MKHKIKNELENTKNYKTYLVLTLILYSSIENFCSYKENKQRVEIIMTHTSTNEYYYYYYSIIQYFYNLIGKARRSRTYLDMKSLKFDKGCSCF